MALVRSPLSNCGRGFSQPVESQPLCTTSHVADSITLQNHEKHFVVMESVFHAAPNGKVHVVYDLKGSWIDRNSGVKAAHGGTYKDMDMCALHSSCCVFLFSPLLSFEFPVLAVLGTSRCVCRRMRRVFWTS